MLGDDVVGDVYKKDAECNPVRAIMGLRGLFEDVTLAYGLSHNFRNFSLVYNTEKVER